MARCSGCGAEVPPGARFCPRCGSPQGKTDAPPKQLSLPLAPWQPTQILQPAGAGAPADGWAVPLTGPPLKSWQIAIAASAVLLFLAFMLLAGGAWRTPRITSGGKMLPVLGVMGQPVAIGRTQLGVAFTDHLARAAGKTPQRGLFLAVGVIIRNQGTRRVLLSERSLALCDRRSGVRYHPSITAWGTPRQINTGRYVHRYLLTPGALTAGIVVFDVPPTLTTPCLLVRDLTRGGGSFSGVIDLTKQR